MVGLYAGLIFYIAATFLISVWSAYKKKQKTAEGFIVGDRNYGSVVTAFSMGTTLASGFAFIGLVGMGYTLGLVATWQCIFGCVLEFLCWFFLAKKLRQLSIKTETVTPIEAMGKLKGDPGNLIKIVGGLMIGLFMVFYLAGQFSAGSKAAIAMELDPQIVAIAVAVLTVAFIFLGGVDAAMWTNAIQGMIMVIAFGVLVFIALSKVGGFSGLFGGLAQTAPELIQWNNGRVTGSAWFYIFNYWLGSAMGFLAQPQALQKYLTIKSEQKIKASCLMSIIFNVIRQLGPVIIGMCCRLIYPELADPETAIPVMIVNLMPNFFGGVLMAGIFAAVMSTTESLLLQSTSELSRNFLQKGVWAKKNISESTYAHIVRLLTVIIGLGGLYISMNASSGVFTMIIFAWTGLFTSIGPALYLGLFWKKCTSQGILAGVLTGIPATTLWYTFLKPATGVHEAYSVIVPLIAVIGVSLATQHIPQQENYASVLD